MVGRSLLNERQLAGILKVSLACIRRWRIEGRGPRFRKLGVLVRYDEADLRDWLDSLPTGGGQAYKSRR